MCRESCQKDCSLFSKENDSIFFHNFLPRMDQGEKGLFNVVRKKKMYEFKNLIKSLSNLGIRQVKPFY